MLTLNQTTKRFLCFLAVTALFLSGCAVSAESTQSTEATQPETTFNLHLTYKPDQEHYATFDEEDLNGAFKGELEYFQIKDVQLKTGDTTKPLEEALRDGSITFHEIRYRAQQDAAAGECYETLESKRGLTRFCYDYLSYKLYITDDIYETPDGNKHHIRKILVTTTGNKPVTVYPELDQEDWGIAFEVADVRPTGITLRYSQYEGQLIGQLCVGNYSLSRLDTNEAVFELENAPIAEFVELQHNTESSLELNWEQKFGPLESGHYYLYIYLHDDYAPEEMPPLVRNYHDMQCYGVEFTIP